MINLRWTVLAEECWDERIDGYHFDQEMFAKLIIKECIRLCDEVDLAGADDCIDKIKDNFGVNDDE